MGVYGSCRCVKMLFLKPVFWQLAHGWGCVEMKLSVLSYKNTFAPLVTTACKDIANCP